MIRREKHITRAMVQAHPEWIFVFGDNVERTGFGGQAAAMRDEPNTIGVVTKWSPGMEDEDFFTDAPACFNLVFEDLSKVAAVLEAGGTVVFPLDGIGTGLAQLPQRAPYLFQLITAFFSATERHFNRLAEQRVGESAMQRESTDRL